MKEKANSKPCCLRRFIQEERVNFKNETRGYGLITVVFTRHGNIQVALSLVRARSSTFISAISVSIHLFYNLCDNMGYSDKYQRAYFKMTRGHLFISRNARFVMLAGVRDVALNILRDG